MTDAQIQTLRGLLDDERQSFKLDTLTVDEEDALRAALTLASQTCGTCKWWEEDPDKPGDGVCDHFSDGRHVSDGCRLGWVAKA